MTAKSRTAATLLRDGRFFFRTLETTMQHDKHETSTKHDLRDKPASSVRDADVKSTVHDPQRYKPEDPQDRRAGPDIVKPGMGSPATGQTTHQ
jgi:hypothetical protein